MERLGRADTGELFDWHCRDLRCREIVWHGQGLTSNDRIRRWLADPIVGDAVAELECQDTTENGTVVTPPKPFSIENSLRITDVVNHFTEVSTARFAEPDTTLSEKTP